MSTTTIEEKECVICYEVLQSTNLCVPPCGHEFCFKCMMQHVQRNNGCPCCRAPLIEESEIVDDSEDEDYEEESDVESIQGEDDDYDGVTEESYPIEKLVETFEAKGYGLKDAISLLMFKFSKSDPKYTKAYIQQLEMDVEDAHEDLEKQYKEQVTMAGEDVNAIV